MKRQFRQIKFDCRVEIPIEVIGVSEDDDNVILTLNMRACKKELNSLSREKILNVIMQGRGWNIGTQGMR